MGACARVTRAIRLEVRLRLTKRRAVRTPFALRIRPLNLIILPVADRTDLVGVVRWLSERQVPAAWQGWRSFMELHVPSDLAINGDAK